MVPRNPTATLDDRTGSPLPEVWPGARFTWYTVGLSALLISVALLTRHASQKNPRPFSIRAEVFGLIFEWALFLVAYRGILASGARFSDAMGPLWSSFQKFWQDFKNALLVIFTIFAATFFLMRFGPVTPAHTPHARTGLQYVVTLLVAVSAGYAEEVVFRGFLLRQFRTLTGNMVAAVILQTILFSLAHGGNQSFVGFVKHGFSGCLFAYLTIRRQSLWPAILAHILLDVLGFTARFLTG